MNELVAEIPRLHTALAEAGACAVFLLLLADRFRPLATIALTLLGALLLVGIQLWVGTWPLMLWIPGMLFAFAGMFFLIKGLIRLTPQAAGYLAARAFVLAELTASLHAQLDRFYFSDASPAVRTAFLVFAYVAVLAVAWCAERRQFSRGDPPEVGGRDLIGALSIAAVTFGISNLSFLNSRTPFSARLGLEIAAIRTLVDLCGYIALYVQHGQRRAQSAHREAEAVAQMMRSQHEQHEISRRAMDEVNRKYHDMKHHLEAIRAASDPAVHGELLSSLEASIQDYGAQVHTGNRVLDAVLTAKRMHALERGVEVSYVVDGELLHFIEPLDLTSILGNALDNAIEAAMRLPEGRLVHLAVFAQDSFVMLRVENTFDGTVHRRNGKYLTRKHEPGHGYGLRNIHAAVERYDGSVSIDTSQQWFALRVLFPRSPGERAPGDRASGAPDAGATSPAGAASPGQRGEVGR